MMKSMRLAALALAPLTVAAQQKHTCHCSYPFLPEPPCVKTCFLRL